MGHNEETHRSAQMLVNDNIHFLASLVPEDIEYSDNAIKRVEVSALQSQALFEQLKSVDVAGRYFDTFPRDAGAVEVDGTFFRWKIVYCNERGIPLAQDVTYRDLLGSKDVKRFLQITIEEDDNETCRQPRLSGILASAF